jgi:hypothetical protein
MPIPMADGQRSTYCPCCHQPRTWREVTGPDNTCLKMFACDRGHAAPKCAQCGSYNTHPQFQDLAQHEQVYKCGDCGRMLTGPLDCHQTVLLEKHEIASGEGGQRSLRSPLPSTGAG